MAEIDLRIRWEKALLAETAMAGRGSPRLPRWAVPATELIYILQIMIRLTISSIVIL